MKEPPDPNGRPLARDPYWPLIVLGMGPVWLVYPVLAVLVAIVSGCVFIWRDGLSKTK